MEKAILGSGLPSPDLSTFHKEGVLVLGEAQCDPSEDLLISVSWGWFLCWAFGTPLTF